MTVWQKYKYVLYAAIAVMIALCGVGFLFFGWWDAFFGSAGLSTVLGIWTNQKIEEQKIEKAIDEDANRQIEKMLRDHAVDEKAAKIEMENALKKENGFFEKATPDQIREKILKGTYDA